MTIYKQKLQFIKESYQERLHADHERCGDLYCTDAGGAIISEIPEEEIKQFYEDNKKEVDEQFAFENGHCQEISVNPVTDNFILGFFGGGKHNG